MASEVVEMKEEHLPITSVDYSSLGPPTAVSASGLLSTDFNPNKNPKKDEIVHHASVHILEIENVLTKMDVHFDKQHRKSLKRLQDFEQVINLIYTSHNRKNTQKRKLINQIHSELSKIQSTLISDDESNAQSMIDPFIIIAQNDEKEDDEKDDEKEETIHNHTITQLEPFQSLVTKIQKEISGNSDLSPSAERSAIKMKKSELHTITDYVNEHRNKMKEKTYRYEEKKKQIKHAKERLDKAKARFRKRLKYAPAYLLISFVLCNVPIRSKSKSKEKHRKRTYSDNKYRHNKYHHLQLQKVSVSDSAKPRLSQNNLNKFNHNTHSSSPLPKHQRKGTSSSIASAFSTISDQSFVDDFHSITAELVTIDEIIHKEVKSGSMSSIFGAQDLGSPESSSHGMNGKKDIKTNISLMSGSSESNTKELQFCVY